MRWWAVGLLAVVACTGEPDEDSGVDPDEAPLVGPEDGRYVVGFQRGGDHFGLGSFNIRRNVVRGGVRTGDGLDIGLVAKVLRDGTIRIQTLDVEGGHEVELISGQAGQGIVEGTYTLDGELGQFAGRRVSGLTLDSPTADFDGAYEIAIVLDGEEVAVSVAHVAQGRVQTTLVDSRDVSYDVQGFVTSDGTFVLTDAGASDGEEVLAEATIDQDSYDVNGVYRSGDFVGRIVGRRAD